MRARFHLSVGYRALGLAMTAVLAANCGGGSDLAADSDLGLNTAEVLPATAVPVPTAEPEPTATLAPEPTSTAAAEPTPTLIPHEEFAELAVAQLDDIKTVHHRFMTEFLAQDERTPEGVELYVALANELTAEYQLDLSLTRLQERQANGEFVVSPGYETHPGEIQVIAANRVRVFDCSSDPSVMYGANGTVQAESSGAFKWRSTDLKQVDGKWRVVSFKTDWDEACEPA